MQIIPVIDLLGGVVVHAKQGERQHYLPIQSQLTPSHQPLDIVAALLDVFPFKQLYIADLDAIQKLGSHYSINYSVIADIQTRYPTLELWVDAGISNHTELHIWQELGVHIVIGSENFASIDNYHALNLPNKHFILSLDFMPNGFQGAIELLNNTAHWPHTVILMSLAHVGSNQGANTELLEKTLARAPHFNLYVAGGIRNATDLQTLKNKGAKGALIASALHQKQILKGVLEV
ncbi:MAG: nickel transporter [Methylotenera sp.]|nr:nickel transporter [Methylotenera sp.]